MPNQRIRNKYQNLYNELSENDTKISKKSCKKLIYMFGHRNMQTKLGILHPDDLEGEDLFENHKPGGKYHAEDCNYNNPNNQIYHRRKHPKNTKQTKRWHFKIKKR